MEYFYHENPPPLVESALPPLLEDGDESGFNPTAPSQPQRLLQPEIVLPPSPPSKHSQTGSNQPPNTDHTDAQGHATKLLNSN